MQEYEKSEQGWFPLFVPLADRIIVVFGGGKIAGRRISTLLSFGGRITAIAPVFSEQFAAWESTICMKKKKYERQDLEGAYLVLAATDDRQVNDEIARACREKGILVNHAGDKSQCDFYFPGVIRKDHIVIGVTAGGKDHRQASVMTDKIRRLTEGKSE